MRNKQTVKVVLLSGSLLWLSSFTVGQPGDRSVETQGWHPFESSDTADPGMIGMNSWLEAPAGKFGRIKRDGYSLVYNNESMRIRGINNTFAECAPDTSMASKRAAFYAKYEINPVRLHKYGDGTKWRGILGGESFSEFDPEGLDRMDYYISELKSRGIYIKLSPSFVPPRLMPEDRRTVP